MGRTRYNDTEGMDFSFHFFSFLIFLKSASIDTRSYNRAKSRCRCVVEVSTE